MATVVKSWVFLSNAEGLADVGLSGVNFNWSGAIGSPAVGAVYFSNLGGGPSGTEKARTGAGVTWETWGVPAGSTVTSVQVAEIRFYRNYVVDTSTTFKVRIVNSSDTTVHSAGDLTSLVDHSTLDWSTFTNGATRNVDASYQASTTAVKLELECILSTANNDDYGMDTLSITITYTEGGGGFAAKMRRAFSQFSQRVGVRQAQ